MEILTLQPNKEDAGRRVDAWMAANLEDMTRSAAARLLEEGRVTCGGKALAKNYKLTGAETLEVDLPEPEPVDVAPQDIPLDVVYEDGDVIVVNKPKGLVVHPAPGHPDGTLVNALLYHCGDSLSGIGGELRPGIVHRIDRVRLGYVVDMFDFQFINYPVFNIADCCIVCGCIMGAIWYLWLYEKYDKKGVSHGDPDAPTE